MSDDYVNQLTLNFLMSKTQMAKLNKKIAQDTSNNLKSDKAIFREDIKTLFNNLLDNDIPSDLLGDVKDCFDHFIDKSIYYIKLHKDNIKNNETNDKINDDDEYNDDEYTNDDEYNNDEEDIVDDYEINENENYEGREKISNEINGIIEDDSDDEVMNNDEVSDDEVMSNEADAAEIVDDKVKIINEVENVVIKKYKDKRSLESNKGEKSIKEMEDEDDVKLDNHNVKVNKKSKQKGLKTSNGVDDIYKLPVDWFHNVRQNYKVTQILPRKKELYIPR